MGVDMETAQHFMESFLRDRAALHETLRSYSDTFQQKYFAPGYLQPTQEFWAMREKYPEEIASVEVTDGAALIITLERIGRARQQARYHRIRVTNPA